MKNKIILFAFCLISIFVKETFCQDLTLNPNNICGTDDRVPSNYAAVGRIRGSQSGTGFIIANGKIVSAGHIRQYLGEGSYIEFNVKPSSADGTKQPSDAKDIYLVNINSIQYMYNASESENYNRGKDWMVFSVFPNSITGLTPIESQKAFFICNRASSASTIRLVGYGVDNGSSNQVQQTSTGSYIGYANNFHKYDTDSENGLSGGPIIDEVTGFVMGVHTTGACSTDGYNGGTGFTHLDFWTATGLANRITIDQQRENGSKLSGTTISHFETRFTTDGFIDYQIPLNNVISFQFNLNSIEAFRASQTIVTNPSEKYNQWNNYNDVTNHKNFTIDNTVSSFISKFRSINSGVRIKNVYPEIPGLDPTNDVVNFKDPWFIDYADPARNNSYRNRGFDAIFYSRSSPFNPDFFTTYENSQSYRGVFLNQDPSFLPDLPNYSVQSQEPIIYVSQTNKTHNFYLGYWGGTDVIFENTFNRETGLAFTSGTAEAIAYLKGTQLTNNVNGFINNNQRKLIRTSNGALHLVYESLGKIWYEMSTDNGVTWNMQNNGKPLSSNQSKLPAIDFILNDIIITWQEKYFESYKIKIAYYLRPGSQIITQDVFDETTYYPPYNPYSFDAMPVIAWENNQMMICWKDQGGLHYRYGYNNSYSSPTWYTSAVLMSGTDDNSTNPTIAVRKDAGSSVFHLGWQQGYAQIKYCTLTPTAQNTISISTIETPSTGDGFNSNKFPSISVAIAGGNPTLVWDGRIYESSSTGQVTVRSKVSGTWEASFRKYGSTTQFPTHYNGTVLWSESNVNKMFRWGSIKTLSTVGTYLQISNGLNENSMYAVAQRHYSPYLFQTTQSIGSIPKENSIVSKCGREGIITKGKSEFYFILADVVVDNKTINFSEANNIMDVENTAKLSSFLMTEAFAINDKSNFTFNIASGITDSLAAIKEIENEKELSFKIELIDANSNETITKIDKIVFDKKDIHKYLNQSYVVNTEGIGQKEVKLRVQVNSNFDAIYNIADILTESEVLGKSNLQQISLKENGLVTTYDLFQNYPNPFNPVTVISYQLPKAGQVTLKIFDALGKEVVTLVNEYKDQGRYTSEFNGSSLASGIYLYELRAGDYVSSKKMLMIK